MFKRNKLLDRKKLSIILTLFISVFMLVTSVLPVNVLVADDDQTQEGETVLVPEENDELVLVCSKDEHTHDETCFDEEENLICEKQEHTHDEKCYVVPLEEIPADERAVVEIIEREYEEEVVYEFDDVDFSSLRLIVSIDEDKLLENGNVLSNIGSLYLIQFDSVEETQNAYDYYLENSEFVDIDVPMIIMEDADINNVDPSEMNQENNPFTELNNALEKIQEENHDRVIALIDSGVNGEVVDAVSMISDNAADENGHGTRMFNIIKEKAPNASVVSVKVLNAQGTGDLSSLFAGIVYAVEYGANYIVMPLAAYQPDGSKLIDKAISLANEKGVVVIAAAGNYNTDAGNFVPASNNHVLTIGAALDDSTKLSFSNYGDVVDYYVVAESTSEASAKFAGILFNSTLENVASDPLVIKPENITILGNEEYQDYELGLVKAARENSCQKLWNSGNQACPIENDDIIRKTENPRNHTYVEILGKRYYLPDDMHDIPKTIPDKTPVRFKLVVELPPDLQANQPLYYLLPDSLAWNPDGGSILEKGTGNVVGSYSINNNAATLIFTEEYLKENSGSIASMIIDGYVDYDKWEDNGEEPINIEGMGDIDIEDVPKPDNALVLKKFLAERDKSENISNWITLNDDGTINVYYKIVVGSVSDEIKNIHLVDELVIDLESGSLDLEPEYVGGSFMFGSAYGENDLYEQLGKPNVTITPYYYESIQPLDPLDPPIKTKGITKYEIDPFDWDSIEAGHDLVITYAVKYKPSKGAAYTDPTKNNFALATNTITGEGDEVNDTTSSADFTYESKPIDKKASGIDRPSYAASWTVTLNDYGDLTGFMIDGKNIIIDKLEPAEYKDQSGVDQTATHVGYFDKSGEQVEALFTSGSPDGFSISGQRLNPETNKLVSIPSSQIFDDMLGCTDPTDETSCTIPITNNTEFVKYFIMNSDSSGGTGILAPSNVKYVITFRSQVDPSEQVDGFPTDADKKVSYKPEGATKPIELTVYLNEANEQYVKYDDGTSIKYLKVSNDKVTTTEVTKHSDTDPAVKNDKPITLKNNAENGDDNLEDSSTSEDGIGVGPSQPGVKKQQRAATEGEGDEKKTLSDKHDWVIALQIYDDKVQVNGNMLYDYLEPGHTIDQSVDVEFYYYEAGKLPTASADLGEKVTSKSWSELTGIVELNKDHTEVEGSGTNPPKPTKDNQADKPYNFSINIGEAAKAGYFGDSVKDLLPGKGQPSGDGLKIGDYAIKFRTSLDLSPTGPVSGSNFMYKNNAFAIKANNGDLIPEKAETPRTILTKTDLLGKPDLFKKGTGKNLEDLSFQEIPWFISALNIVSSEQNHMELKDVFARAAENNTIGDMKLVEDSVVIYQTDKDLSTVTVRDNLNYGSDEAPRLTKGVDYEIVVKDNPYDGFDIIFKDGRVTKARVAIFYITIASNQQIDKDKELTYRNTVTLDLPGDGVDPSATDYANKDYKVLKKNVEPNEETRVAHYSIDVNRSKLDLNLVEGEEGNWINVTDTLDEFIVFIASSFKAYKVSSYDGSGNPVGMEELVKDVDYTIDASETTEDNKSVIKLRLPDKTSIRLEYDANISYSPEDGGKKTLTNTIVIEGFYPFSSSAKFVVSAVEHSAEVEGSKFNIRLLKYDQDEPTKSLPDAEFDIYAYHVIEKDGVRELELLDPDLLIDKVNPFHIITDEYGEFVFHGRYDVVYKVVETKAPEGYIIADVAEYFVHPGNQEHDYFVDILDEYGNTINPEIYHLYEDTDEIRYTMANRKAPYGLLLRKTGVDGKEVLTGAVFNLYAKAEKDGAEDILIRENMRVNENGELSILNLDPGIYYLKEIEAPEGYWAYPYKLKIEYDGETEYKVDNHFYVSYTPSQEESEPNLLIYKNGIVPIPNTGVR